MFILYILYIGGILPVLPEILAVELERSLLLSLVFRKVELLWSSRSLWLKKMAIFESNFPRAPF